MATFTGAARARGGLFHETDSTVVGLHFTPDKEIILQTVFHQLWSLFYLILYILP